MVLTDSELHCNNGQKEIYSLAVVIVYTRITVFRSLTTILTIAVEKKTHISRFQFKNFIHKSFCSSEVLVLTKRSVAPVMYSV